ncbi:DUF793 domain-containing protein [Cephalotus follicularis]|uniref:DUF793 domain-containing protein n=1 Tax=Cephalotus follicularis TaxID=3775 RepID=A0A1Q3CX11_CEPFO|nr:DUF793 domain-containing protein [Cephalotus follicularis]
MPATTDCQRRSILSLGIHSMESRGGGSSEEGEVELERFQRQVADRFTELSSSSCSHELLSISWIRKLLDVFLSCQQEFGMILCNNRSVVNKQPMDRLIEEFMERSVKALDVCNAIRDGIQQIRLWEKMLEIVLISLDSQKVLGEGQVRRAKKALIDLAIGMLDDKDSGTSLAHRNRSFGRHNNTSNNHYTNTNHTSNGLSRDHHHHHIRSLGHFRSLSWSVSRSWSAARQLQAIGNNLAAPRGNEIVASNGLAVPLFTMSSVLLFVMWAIVAAIPCQDRGLHVHFNIPRQFTWAAPLLSLHEKILEESKKRDRKNACGLLREIYQMEKYARLMSELVDSVNFPLTEEKEGEVKERVAELAQLCEAMNVGLDPLERQVREVFHRIVRSRTEGLDSSGRGHSTG